MNYEKAMKTRWGRIKWRLWKDYDEWRRDGGILFFLGGGLAWALVIWACVWAYDMVPHWTAPALVIMLFIFGLDRLVGRRGGGD